ncbi:CHAT domain-containing protein [Actinosynnema sp. NPDC051121]|nr:CHAT domain-containing protein [Saccharothrix sp.]
MRVVVRGCGLREEIVRRVERFTRHGDADAVLRGGVLALAAPIWRRAMSDGGCSLDDMVALARLHWCRHHADPDHPEAGSELRTALRLFHAVHRGAPDAVPEEVRPHLIDADTIDSQFAGPRHWRTRAVALLRQVRHVDDPAKLDEVVELLGGVVEVYPPGHERRPADMSNLATALQFRAARTGDPADLDRAIDIARDAARQCAPGSVEEGRRLTTLAMVLSSRASLTGDGLDITEAIQFATQAVRYTPASDEFRTVGLTALSGALATRYDLRGDPDDLDQAIAHSRAALTAADTPSHRSNLAGQLVTRFRASGRMADLDEAVRELTEAVGRTRDDNPFRTGGLSNLADALLVRFARTEDGQDLADAHAAARHAVATAGQGHVDLPGVLAVSGEADMARYRFTGDSTALDEAVEAFTAAVDHCRPEHPHRPGYQARLAAALEEQVVERTTPLRQRWRRELRLVAPDDTTTWAGDPEQLTRAVELRRQALARLAPHDRRRGGHLDDLASALWLRHLATGSTTDRDEALRSHREAMTYPAARSSAALNLARRLPADHVEEILELCREVVADRSATTSDRASAAARWAETAADHAMWNTALNGYTAAVDLLGPATTHGLDRAVRERHLARWSGLASEAASCALHAGDPDRALELLEQARGVIWAQLLDTSEGLTALRAADPQAADRLAELDTALRHRPDDPDPWQRRLADRRLHLAQERDELLDRIRAQPGFTHFLRPPHAADLRRAATDGPVIVVNVSQWRADALIVTTDDTTVLPLGIDHATVLARATRYLVALEDYENTHDPTARVVLNQHLVSLLDWLWHEVARPVLDALGPVRRVWWSPAGILALLPLHAAGVRGGPGLLDHVVSSYTPTLRALVECRDRAATTATGFLAVGMTTTPGQLPLPQVQDELDAVAVAFPAARVLRDEQATRAAVRDALRDAAWAHLSCHGAQDPANPSGGGIELHDGRLTVADLGEVTARGEFAFLSACHTARGALTVPDEAVTLAGALHYLGWRHVIGTLWSVDATSAATVTADVYRALGRDGALDPTDAALALHHAVRRLRDEHPRQPITWAPLVHSGI